MRTRNKYMLTGFLFVLPSFLYFLFVFLYPLILSFVNSLCRVNLLLNTKQFVGFQNFANLFSREYFWQSLVITLKFAVICVPMMMVVDLFVAERLSRLKGSLGAMLTTLSFLPFIVSMAAAGMVWDWILDPNFGLMNALLGALHLPQPLWLRSPDSALYSTLLITLWIRAPFGIMILLGGIQNVPTELYEAASIDGVNTWQKFWYVTLPQLKNTTFFILIMLTIQCFKVYDIVYMLAGAGSGALSEATTVLVYEIYNSAFRYWRLGVASAEALVLFAIVLVVTIVQFKLDKD